jgi:hypothetical protein
MVVSRISRLLHRLNLSHGQGNSFWRHSISKLGSAAALPATLFLATFETLLRLNNSLELSHPR